MRSGSARTSNVLDPGQMLLWHVVLPLVVGVLVVWHVILVRRHGVVPPFDAVPPEPAGAAAAEPAEPEPAESEAAEAGPPGHGPSSRPVPAGVGRE
jgi:ubiquinol-cytochrome c reductase cytochrome b subunit